MLVNRKKTFSLVIIALVAFTLVLSGCGQTGGTPQGGGNAATVKDGGEFRFGMISSPSSLDPAFLEENNGIEIGKEIFDGLVQYDNATLETKPAIAEKWDISADGKVYTFHLRKGVKFHDGTEVKAKDFVDSWNRLAAKDTASPVSFPLEPIKGFKEVNEGTAKTMSGVVAKDDYTLEVTLNQPNAAFLASLGHPAVSVYKVAAAVAAGKDFGTPSTKPEQLIGAGPFKFVEWKADDHVTIAKFADYYGSNKAHVDKVTYRIFKDENTALNEFKAGTLDYVDSLPAGQRQAIIKQYPGQTKLEPSLVIQYLGFNLTKPPFKDNLNFRKAIAYAVDKQAVIDTVLEGISTPAKGPIPVGMWGVAKDLAWPEFDKAKAQDYLKKAFPDGKVPTVEYKYNFNQGNQKVAEAIQGMLKDAGIPTQLKNMEWGAYIKSLQSGDSQMFRLAWGLDYPDPDNVLYALYSSKQAGSNNDTFYSNPKVDQLLEQGRVETDQAKRVVIYKDIQQQLLDDQPAAWLFNTTYVHLWAPYVKNFTVNALDQKDMTQVWLDK